MPNLEQAWLLLLVSVNYGKRFRGAAHSPHGGVDSLSHWRQLCHSNIRKYYYAFEEIGSLTILLGTFTVVPIYDVRQHHDIQSSGAPFGKLQVHKLPPTGVVRLDLLATWSPQNSFPSTPKRATRYRAGDSLQFQVMRVRFSTHLPIIDLNDTDRTLATVELRFVLGFYFPYY
jgi:hypothetical protein